MLDSSEILNTILNSVDLETSDYIEESRPSSMAESLIFSSSFIDDLIASLTYLLEDAFKQKCGISDIDRAYGNYDVTLGQFIKNEYVADYINVEALDCSEEIRNIVKGLLDRRGWFTSDGYIYYSDEDTAEEWQESL